MVGFDEMLGPDEGNELMDGLDEGEIDGNRVGFSEGALLTLGDALGGTLMKL